MPINPRVHDLVGRIDRSLNGTESTDRSMSFRISTHFHPYVETLRKRVASGVRNLLDSDTEYVPAGADGRRAVVPGSVLLETDANFALGLQAGRHVVLGQSVDTVSAGRNVSLPENLVCRLSGPVTVTHYDPATGDGVKSSSRFRVAELDADGQPRPITLPSHQPTVSLAAGDQLVVAENTGVFLAMTATVQLGALAVTVDARTKITLLAGTPVSFVTPSTPENPWRVISYLPQPTLSEELFGKAAAPSQPGPPYAPNREIVTEPYPRNELDFASSGAYSVYNWELFFHVPLTIAIHLSKSQRFAEAQEWFHSIFDPTDDSDGPPEERYWKVRPFQHADMKSIETILVNLASQSDPELARETVNSINRWMSAPFRPHLIARFRQAPYMLKTVTAYLDNLIDWGDSLFRQDTIESINEATQIYVLAANILGPRPQLIPKKATSPPKTYAALRGDLNEFSDALVAAESVFPFDIYQAPDVGGHDGLSTIQSIGRSLFFCIPRNDQLLEYWDIVADRLFKIRNSLNLQGVFRQLPLFEPRIDPGLLVAAAASGLDVDAIIAGLSQPLPLVRFQLLVQKAAEICQEVKSLGANLLSAIEKQDNEAMAVLRASHESTILGMAEVVKISQLHEATKAREGLEQSLAVVKYRYSHYARLLGENVSDFADLAPLAVGSLKDDTAQFEEPAVPPCATCRSRSQPISTIREAESSIPKSRRNCASLPAQERFKKVCKSPS